MSSGSLAIIFQNTSSGLCGLVQTTSGHDCGLVVVAIAGEDFALRIPGQLGHAQCLATSFFFRMPGRIRQCSHRDWSADNPHFHSLTSFDFWVCAGRRIGGSALVRRFRLRFLDATESTATWVWKDSPSLDSWPIP